MTDTEKLEELRGSTKQFTVNALQQFAKQEVTKVTKAAKERSIDEIVDDDPYADLIRGS